MPHIATDKGLETQDNQKQTRHFSFRDTVAGVNDPSGSLCTICLQTARNNHQNSLPGIFKLVVSTIIELGRLTSPSNPHRRRPA